MRGRECTLRAESNLYTEAQCIKAIYHRATLARDIPGSAAYFVGYEYFYQLMKNNGYSLTSSALFAGGMAGVSMWSIAIPPDVIKSRIQSAPAGIICFNSR